MSDKHSIASKARWAKISKEDRSRMMSERVAIRWKKTSKEDRVKLAKKLVAARKVKK